MTVTHTVASTPLGDLTLVADDGVLTGVFFPHHWHRPDPAGFGERDDTGFAAVLAQLEEYLAGQRTSFDLPVRADGDEFQHRVWDLIAAIPYGETASYGELARRLGDGAAAKDVGSATGRNPLSVVVPCHRVVGKDGSLTGYAGGLKRKRFLLDLESARAGAGAGAGSGRLF
jgi:methylated-DNA-[protein]-cysteine S-methyltransferase